MSELFNGSVWQRLRIASGLVLFLFALTHFVNHALGVFDIDTMLAMQRVRTAITRSLPGGLILYGALSAYIALALARLLQRSSMRMPL
jgi:adenylate cyclase